MQIYIGLDRLGLITVILFRWVVVGVANTQVLFSGVVVGEDQFGAEDENNV